jgi:hypothetical protein
MCKIATVSNPAVQMQFIVFLQVSSSLLSLTNQNGTKFQTANSSLELEQPLHSTGVLAQSERVAVVPTEPVLAHCSQAVRQNVGGEPCTLSTFPWTVMEADEMLPVQGDEACQRWGCRRGEEDELLHAVVVAAVTDNDSGDQSQ